MRSLQPFSAGRACMSLVAISNALSPFIADWNETHIYNPRWPPHARFHNGQTMSMGVCLGLLTLYLAWRSTPNPKDSLWNAALVGSLYWVTGMSAILYPGALAIDPEFGEGNPQMIIFGVHLTLTWVGYWLATRSMNESGGGIKSE